MRRYAEEEDPLALPARKDIYAVVEQNPGLHFREIQRRLSIATGALQYHLDYLSRKHYVKTERQGKFLRYYSTRTPSLGPQQTLMSALRQESLRKIILFLLSKRFATVPRIAREVNLSQSTVLWHLKKLLDDRLVERKTHNRQSVYLIVDKKTTAEFVKNHRASFIDRLVDNFVSIWDASAVTPQNTATPKSFSFPKND